MLKNAWYPAIKNCAAFKEFSFAARHFRVMEWLPITRRGLVAAAGALCAAPTVFRTEVRAVALVNVGITSALSDVPFFIANEYGYFRRVGLWSIGAASSSLAAHRAAMDAQRESPSELRQPALSFAERFHDHQNGAYRL